TPSTPSSGSPSRTSKARSPPRAATTARLRRRWKRPPAARTPSPTTSRRRGRCHRAGPSAPCCWRPVAPRTPRPSTALTSRGIPRMGGRSTGYSRRSALRAAMPRPTRSSRASIPPGSTPTWRSWPRASERARAISKPYGRSAGGLSAREHAREHERRHDRRVALDDEARRVRAELAPRDLLVRDGAGVRAVARRRVRDLAEVGPQRRRPLQVLLEHRNDADREVARDAAADLEESDPGLVAVGRVPVGEPGHVLDPRLDGVRALDVTFEHVRGEDVAGGRVLPAGDDHRQVLLGGGDEPRVLRVDLIELFEPAGADDPVEELVREVAAAVGLGGLPLVEDGGFEAAERFLLGDAGVRDAVHPAVEERLLVGGGEVAPAGDALVVVVRDEVEEVFFEVGAGTRDDVDLVLPDHLGEREAEFGRAHGAGERDEHPAARVEVGDVAVSGVHERGGVEVAVVVADEPGDGGVVGGGVVGGGGLHRSGGMRGESGRVGARRARAR